MDRATVFHVCDLYEDVVETDERQEGLDALHLQLQQAREEKNAEKRQV